MAAPPLMGAPRSPRREGRPRRIRSTDPGPVHARPTPLRPHGVRRAGGHARRRVRSERREGSGRRSSSFGCRSTGCGAAWLARLTGGQEVAGSNPASPTEPNRNRIETESKPNPGRPGLPLGALGRRGARGGAPGGHRPAGRGPGPHCGRGRWRPPRSAGSRHVGHRLDQDRGSSSETIWYRRWPEQRKLQTDGDGMRRLPVCDRSRCPRRRLRRRPLLLLGLAGRRDRPPDRADLGRLTHLAAPGRRHRPSTPVGDPGSSPAQSDQPDEHPKRRRPSPLLTVGRRVAARREPS
jgi:hypothetical protein